MYNDINNLKRLETLFIEGGKLENFQLSILHVNGKISDSQLLKMWS